MTDLDWFRLVDLLQKWINIEPETMKGVLRMIQHWALEAWKKEPLPARPHSPENNKGCPHCGRFEKRCPWCGTHGTVLP